MPLYDDTDRLRHMRDAAGKAIEFCKDKTRADLDRNEMLVLALVRLLEIIGEASIRISVESRAKLPGIQWREIAGTRNRLIHGYADVNLDIVWATISNDLPKLFSELENLLPRQAD
jgi:uncharacterized protein with HEPN domain